MTWEDEGLRGPWFKGQLNYTEEVVSVTRRGRGTTLKCRIPDPKGYVWVEIFLGDDEEDGTIQKFKELVTKDHAYLLCQHEISEGEGMDADRSASSQALVVEAQDGCKENDIVDVLFVVALTDVVGISTPEEVSVLLRH